MLRLLPLSAGRPALGGFPPPLLPEASLAPPASSATEELAADAPATGPDLARIGQTGAVAGLAQGGPLGLSFALCAWTRARCRPHLKVFSGFAPLMAAFLTAPAEQALRAGLGTQPTLPRQPSLAHDAIPGAVLFLATLAWQRLPGPPRPSPTSAAGMAATVAVSMVGSLLGGMLCEVSAQRSHEDRVQAPAGDRAAAPPARVIPVLHKGMGRALSLLPLAFWLQGPAGLATAGRPLPRWIGLAGTGVACAGWTFRRVLTHPAPVPSPAKAATAGPDRENPAGIVEKRQCASRGRHYHSDTSHLKA